MSQPTSSFIFIHIPKTAGKTLEFILEKSFPQNKIYNVYGYEDSIPKKVEYLAALTEPEKNKIRLIKGHYQYGLHQYLPQSASYFTFLRDPINRVISHYNYVSRDKKHPFYEKIKTQKITLKNYVEQGFSTELNNGQTRLISGQEKIHAFGQTPESLLDLAMENINNHFCFVGFVEYFNESLVFLQQAIGLADIRYISLNQTQKTKSACQLDPETLSTLEHFNALDIALFNQCKDHFEKQLREQKEFISSQLEILEKQNRRYVLQGKMHEFFKKIQRRIVD